MTSRADFTDEEWDLVVAAPRWVVAAASAAQRDLAYRTDHEIEQGFVATAHGRCAGNDFVTAVAAETMKIFDSRTFVADFEDRSAGLDATVNRVAAVVELLAARASAEDAKAYRKWLVEIADVVIRAARSHDILGFGGELVTASERGFRDRLVLTLQQR
jgi:hypothetical protein